MYFSQISQVELAIFNIKSWSIYIIIIVTLLEIHINKIYITLIGKISVNYDCINCIKTNKNGS